MKARITINMNKNQELEIWLNGPGRDPLVRELQRLGEENDHFHFMPEDMGAVGVSNRGYREDDTVIEWGKVMFRTEEWMRVTSPMCSRCFPNRKIADWPRAYLISSEVQGDDQMENGCSNPIDLVAASRDTFKII